LGVIRGSASQNGQRTIARNRSRFGVDVVDELAGSAG